MVGSAAWLTGSAAHAVLWRAKPLGRAKFCRHPGRCANIQLSHRPSAVRFVDLLGRLCFYTCFYVLAGHLVCGGQVAGEVETRWAAFLAPLAEEAVSG